MIGDYEIAGESFLHPRSRLGRARKRFVSLGEEVKDYANAARQLDRRFDAASGWTSYDIRGRRRPPKPLAEGAGAVCEDLRGALDALIGALRATQKQDSDPPRFPICLTSEEYLGEGAERGKRHLLSDLRPADLAMVDSLQPYHRVKPQDDPLARLQARLKVDIRLRFDLRFDPPRLTMSDLDRIRARVEEIVGGFDSRLPAAA